MRSPLSFIIVFFLSGAMACSPQALMDKRNNSINMEIASQENDASSDAKVQIPPGVNAGTIVIQEGAAVATDTTGSYLELPQGTQAGGPAVNVSSSLNVDPAIVSQLIIHLPFTDSDASVAALQGDGNRVVLYHVQSEDGKSRFGILPASAIRISGNHLVFNSVGFGTYQAALISATVTEAKQVTSDVPIITKKQEAVLPAVTWAAPVLSLDSSVFAVTPSVSFEPANLVMKTCVQYLDRDKAVPWDYADPVVIGSWKANTVANKSAHELYGRFVCLDEHGRTLTSPWSLALAIPVRPDFTLAGRSPFIVVSGDSVTLSGNNLRAGLKLTLGGEAVTQVTISSPATASFVVPALSSAGIVNLVASQDGVESRATFYYKPAASSAPVMTLSAADVCSDNTFLDTTGASKLGTKNCTVAPACSSDGQSACVPNGTTFKAVNMISAVAGNILSGITVGGVAGSATVAPADCSGDGQTGCVTTAGFKPASISSRSPGNIRSGISLGGIAGAFPSATYPLSGDTGINDLPSLSASVAAGSYEWWTSDGVRYTGMISDAGMIMPTMANQVFSTSVYREFSIQGSPNLIPANIRNTTQLFSIPGNYPSMTYPLANASATADLTSGSFQSLLKSASSFEWFDSAGIRYMNVGDADINASNIKSGVTIFGLAGTYMPGPNCTADNQTSCFATSMYRALDTTALSPWDIRVGRTLGGISGSLDFYKNMVSTPLFNRLGGNVGSMSGVDAYDTIDDYSNGGIFPAEYPAGWTPAVGANWKRDSVSDTGAGGGVAMDAICNGTEECVYVDRITGLFWGRATATSRNWEASVDFCDTMSLGSYSNWRLPTQKELLQAYVNGIWREYSALNLIPTGYYWTATRDSSTPLTNAFKMNLSQSLSSGVSTSTTLMAICVRS